MATTVETTKLYINGQKVFPTTGSSLTADYSDAGYVPNDIQHIQDGYNYILVAKSTDLETLRNNVNYDFVAWPDLKLADYEDWQEGARVNFNKSENISFNNGKLEIKSKSNSGDEIAIHDMKFLKELLIDSITSNVRINGNKALEKATLNFIDDGEHRIDLSNMCNECENLKEITLNWTSNTFKQISNITYMFHNCKKLTTINSIGSSDYNIDLANAYESTISGDCTFDSCESLTNIPTISGFYKIYSASNMFYHLGWKYKGDLSKQTVDYVIDGLYDPNEGGVSLNGMFKGCPILRSLRIEGENLPTEYDIFGFTHNWDNGFVFDGATPIYEENSSNIIGYYIPDTYTQSFFNTFKLYVHENNVQTWKDALHTCAGGINVVDWYIDNGMVQAYY
jgi:hypothetical protein